MWQYFCKSRRLNRRYQELAIHLCKKRVRRVWMHWRERYLRRLYAHAAYSKTRVKMKINTLRHGLRVWRETYKLSILFRVNEERAIRFRNRRLKLNAFRTWILSLKEQRKRFEDRVRVKSLYMAMSRWRRRVEASSLRRRVAFKVASSRVQNITRRLMYVVRFRTRKKIETHTHTHTHTPRHAWLDRTRISRLGRNEQIVLASSHWAGTLLRKMFRQWHHLSSKSRQVHEHQMSLAANFWYERLMSRMFKRWHAVTMEVLDDLSRYDNEW